MNPWWVVSVRAFAAEGDARAVQQALADGLKVGVAVPLTATPDPTREGLTVIEGVGQGRALDPEALGLLGTRLGVPQADQGLDDLADPDGPDLDWTVHEPPSGLPGLRFLWLTVRRLPDRPRWPVGTAVLHRTAGWRGVVVGHGAGRQRVCAAVDRQGTVVSVEEDALQRAPEDPPAR